MKILLVEDSSVDRMFITHALRGVVDFAHELVACSTLAEAIESMTTTDFDVVLLDLCLPDSEGLETCERALSTFHGMPVVVMTGTDDRVLATEAIRKGAQDYLVKGVFPGSAIARVLQYAIDRFHFQRELAHRESHFQQVLGHVPAIIWTTDIELVITSVEGADLRSITGDPKQILGKSVMEYSNTSTDSAETIAAHRLAVEGKSVSLESKYKGRVYESKIEPLYKPELGIVGTIGLALDVTDRRNLDHEINFARLVQLGLLPCEPPILDRFDIYGGSIPAKQTCGDWYDYLNFSDGSVGLVVGDVSGKGFGPAILSATIAAYLEVLAENHADLREILTLCNRLICRRRLDGQFAVLSIGRLHSGELSVTYGGAGEEIIIIGAGGKLKRQVPASGLPLGVLDIAVYEPSATVSLEPGDVVLFLTDGFREAMNLNNDLFGLQRIVETVANHQHASSAEIFSALHKACLGFADCRNQQDDMTGIVVKVLSGVNGL